MFTCDFLFVYLWRVSWSYFRTKFKTLCFIFSVITLFSSKKCCNLYFYLFNSLLFSTVNLPLQFIAIKYCVIWCLHQSLSNPHLTIEINYDDAGVQKMSEHGNEVREKHWQIWENFDQQFKKSKINEIFHLLGELFISNNNKKK